MLFQGWFLKTVIVIFFWKALWNFCEFYEPSLLGHPPHFPNWIPVHCPVLLFRQHRSVSKEHEASLCWLPGTQYWIYNTMKVKKHLIWAVHIEHVTEVKESLIFFSAFTHTQTQQICICLFRWTLRDVLLFFPLSHLSLRLPEGFVRILTFFFRIISSFHLNFINTDAPWPWLGGANSWPKGNGIWSQGPQGWGMNWTFNLLWQNGVPILSGG